MLPENDAKTVDEILLDESVDQRKSFIQLLMPDGKLPEDPKDKALILKALDGNDKVALGRMRIKADDRASAGQEQVARLLAHVLQSVSGQKNPYLVDVNERPTGAGVGMIPTVPDHLVGINLVDGETSVNPRQLSYQEFTQNTVVTTPLPSAAE